MEETYRLSRRKLLAGALALVGTGALARASDAGFASLNKAVWAWKTTPDDWSALKSFCNAQGIGAVMLSLSADTRTGLMNGNAGVLRKLGELRSGGRTVQALMGEQDWITRRKTSLPRSLADFLKIQQRHATFDGLHLDIEPQLLPQWRAGDRAGVAGQYLTLLSRIRSATSGVPLEVTVHPNYAEVQLAGGETFLARIVASVDRVSLMAYRDQPSAALQFAHAALETFKQTRCSWRFGVLVNSSREAHVSYFGRPTAQFVDEMVSLDRSLRGESTAGYSGLVFEDYGGLRQILA